MKVILQADIKGKGKKYEVIEVANGYGNFLIGKNLAVQATKQNLDNLEVILKEIEANEKKLTALAIKDKETLEQETWIYRTKLAPNGKLVHRAMTKDIADFFNAMADELDLDINIDKHKIEAPMLSTEGVFTIKIKLHRDIEADVKFQIKGY